MDEAPLEILAAKMRQRLADGLSIHPSLLAVMDNLMPGWRDTDAPG